MLGRRDIETLNNILKGCSDNHLKFDVVTELMKRRKFKFIGLGTNRATYVPRDNRNVIIKIALDEFGIEDNLNDALYSKTIDFYNEVFETHPTGIYSVQQTCKGFTDIVDIQPHYPLIMGLLNELKKKYLLVDLSPRNIRNYGTYRKQLRIIDGSDLVPLDQVNPLRCDGMVYDDKRRRTVCNHELEYSDDFHELVCPYCRKRFNPALFKKKTKEVNILKSKNYSTGLTQDELDSLEAFIIAKRNKDAIKEETAIIVENIVDLDEDETDIEVIDIDCNLEDIALKTYEKPLEKEILTMDDVIERHRNDPEITIDKTYSGNVYFEDDEDQTPMSPNIIAALAAKGVNIPNMVGTVTVNSEEEITTGSDENYITKKHQTEQ